MDKEDSYGHKQRFYHVIPANIDAIKQYKKGHSKTRIKFPDLISWAIREVIENELLDVEYGGEEVEGKWRLQYGFEE